MGGKKNFGELLVVNKLINQAQLVDAMEFQRNYGGRLSRAIIKKGFMKEDALTKFISESYNMTPVDLQHFEIGEKLTKLIPGRLARKYNVIPVQQAGQTLVVAISDPSNTVVLEELRFYTKMKIKPVLAGEMAISKAIEKAYLVTERMAKIAGDLKGPEEKLEEMTSRVMFDLSNDEGLPIIRFVNAMILEAMKVDASDIHVETYQDIMRIRFRIDGVLYEQVRPPHETKNQIISRLKIMSSMDISEKRLPQDGRFKVKVTDNRTVEFRVSSIPATFGEKIVMRVIDDANLQADMTKLGMEPGDLQKLRKAIKKPKGLILVTGPTGSGKTQSLYSCILELNTEGVNISTAEDPVEYNLTGINQVWVRDEIGLTFAQSLRAFLRQDPDIIMIGEIRDLETAGIAMKAALTGHIVFSTLHTNDAPSVINRLVDMGVEPVNLMASLNLIMAQRLARKICPRCKEETKFVPSELIKLGVPANLLTKLRAFKGRGCSYCRHTGYKGRIGIFEVLPITEDIIEVVLKGSNTDQLRNEAVRLGMSTLRRDAVNKFVTGIIDIDEVVRITAED